MGYRGHILGALLCAAFALGLELWLFEVANFEWGIVMAVLLPVWIAVVLVAGVMGWRLGGRLQQRAFERKMDGR